MSDAADPFIHLSSLRGRLKPAAESGLRVTAEVLAQWDLHARALGRPPDWRLPDAQVEAARRELLGSLAAADDLWVFAYGSLMWDPGFHFSQVRLATLERWQRRFTFRTSVGRGSPQHPGLMLSLAPAAGACTGLAFRIDAALVEEESGMFWRREMLRGSYLARFMQVETPQGPVRALVFSQNPAHPDHVGELPIDETAAMIAGGEGMLGTNRDYLRQLCRQLEWLGIRDDYLAGLAERVNRLAAD
jgi:glutathione-specific gamma-glutamylcyclotransferase